MQCFPQHKDGLTLSTLRDCKFYGAELECTDPNSRIKAEWLFAFKKRYHLTCSNSIHECPNSTSLSGWSLPNRDQFDYLYFIFNISEWNYSKDSFWMTCSRIFLTTILRKPWQQPEGNSATQIASKYSALAETTTTTKASLDITLAQWCPRRLQSQPMPIFQKAN